MTPFEYRFGKLSLAIITIVMLAISVPTMVAQPVMKLTVDDVLRLALEHNRDYLAASEEVIKAQGEIGRARSGAFPQLRMNSYYSRNMKLAPLFFEADGEVQELQFGFKNNFGASLSLYQPLWEGGKVYTAYAIAKQYKKYSEAGSRVMADMVVYNGELLFHQVILESSRLTVLEKALETYTYNLKVVTQFYDQGLVSRYELLRAQVEKSNIEPQLLATRSNLRLAKKRLKSFLGFDLDQPIELVDQPVDTNLEYLPDLDSLKSIASSERPEAYQAELMIDLRDKAVAVSKADYFPSVGLVSQYDWRSESDNFTLSGNASESWTAGVQMSWSLFDGGRTRSAVSIARAEHRQAKLAHEQMSDQIKLDVEQAYDHLQQARQMLSVQSETIAQAEEGLRIANLRYEAGEGTLLEVLSAQTALTDARTSLAEATFMFKEALASLKKATATDWQ